MNNMDVNKKSKRIVIWVCFLAYLFALFYVLFFAEAFGRKGDVEEYRYNLTLFQEIGRYFRLGITSNLFMINVVGNIVAFIPFGMFLPMLFAKCKNILLTALLSLEFSILIEVTQIVSKVGSFDVDDLLLNTLGGVCGVMLFYAISIIGKNRQNKQHREADKNAGRK